MQKDEVHLWEREARKNKTKKTRQRAARQHILSDVITTRALYTPLVYVFSRGWSVTSTAVRFHLRVLLCRQKYILTRTAGFTPPRCTEHGWQHQKKAERLLGAGGPTVIVGRNWSGTFREMRCCRTYTLETEGGGVGGGPQCLLVPWSPESLAAPLAGRLLTE